MIGMLQPDVSFPILVVGTMCDAHAMDPGK